MTGRDANASASEHRGFPIRTWTVCLAGVIALAATLGSSGGAATQSAPPAGPLAAEPEPNAFLTTSPDRISLTFSEPVDPRSASVSLLRAGGGEAPLDRIQGDNSFANSISARPRETLGAGDYTMAWSARAADDGKLFAGAYPFRTGVAANPGAAWLDGEWPALWAVIPRWLVFLGTSLAAGGFIWARLLAPGGSSAAGSPVRSGTMAIAALVALGATALLPFLNRLLSPTAGALPPLMASLWSMPLGWWIQLSALFVLALLCLGLLASGRATARLPDAIIWVGLGSGLGVLAGLSLTKHALSPSAGLALATSSLDTGAILLSIAHQSSTALWLSGLLYFTDGWREVGSDIARFRRVRWIGGVLLALAVLTGLAGTWVRFTSLGDLLTDRYGQVLAGKGVIVLIVLVLGLVAMVLPRRLNALRTGRSLVTQGALALLALLLAAALALMALPGTVARPTLAGVALADVVAVDRAAFGMESATIHLLTQPVSPGAQSVIVHLTGGHGAALALDPAPDVEVTWTPLSAGAENDESVAEAAVRNVPSRLQPDPSGALFAGTVTLPSVGWWQADVTVTPADGIAARARFWLVLPDPNVTGAGPEPSDDREAQALFARGLASLTSLRSVRYTQRLGAGDGSLYRSQTAVNAGDAERPPAYTDTTVDDAGDVVARQIIVGDRRWILVGEDWVDAEPIPFLTPAEWGEAYVDATGFQLGPREEVDGELSQVVTFWQPPRASPSRAPAWFAWWIGLASGELRREAMVSTQHYMVYGFSDFDAPLEITPPIDRPAPPVAPATPPTPAVATPAAIR